MRGRSLLKARDGWAALSTAQEPRHSFKAQVVKGRLVKVTTTSIEVESEGQVQTFEHGIEYRDLLELAEKYGGEVIVLYVVNNHIKKLTRTPGPSAS